MITILALLLATSSPTFARAPEPGAVAPAALTDGQILAAIAAMDQAEVDLASYARRRSHDPAVQELAQLALDAHNQNWAAVGERMVTEGAPLTESAGASTIKVTGKASLANLQAQIDSTFDLAFVDTMVDRHEAALVEIDSYAAMTRSAGIATFLANTRASMDTMLQHARHTQQMLRSARTGA